MKIRDLFHQKHLIRSFEVFPPRRDGNFEGLFTTIRELRRLEPDFVSVTYGAGGSTRDMTLDIAMRLMDTGILPLVHLTCVGHSQTELGSVLDSLHRLGVRNLLALRGDPPKGETTFTPAHDGFAYASQLVAFIRAHWDFCIGVAGYPETHPDAQSPARDLEALRQKIDAGADFITTQLFFDNDLYYDYVARVRAAGITVPVLPGVMPVLDGRSLARFASFGAKVPADLARGFEAAEAVDAEHARQFGLDHTVRQCKDLLAHGAPGLHLYTMNKAWAAMCIHQHLGLLRADEAPT